MNILAILESRCSSIAYRICRNLMLRHPRQGCMSLGMWERKVAPSCKSQGQLSPLPTVTLPKLSALCSHDVRHETASSHVTHYHPQGCIGHFTNTEQTYRGLRANSAHRSCSLSEISNFQHERACHAVLCASAARSCLCRACSVLTA